MRLKWSNWAMERRPDDPGRGDGCALAPAAAPPLLLLLLLRLRVASLAAPSALSSAAATLDSGLLAPGLPSSGTGSGAGAGAGACSGANVGAGASAGAASSAGGVAALRWALTSRSEAGAVGVRPRSLPPTGRAVASPAGGEDSVRGREEAPWRAVTALRRGPVPGRREPLLRRRPAEGMPRRGMGEVGEEEEGRPATMDRTRRRGELACAPEADLPVSCACEEDWSSPDRAVAGLVPLVPALALPLLARAPAAPRRPVLRPCLLRHSSLLRS